MIRALLILLSLGSTLYAAQMPGGPMPGALDKDSDMDGIDDASDATPDGDDTGSPLNAPAPTDDFNPNDASGMDDDNLSPPTPSAPRFPPNINRAPQQPMANPAMHSGPTQIGRNAYDPDETRGAPVDTSPGASIPGFKQLPADKQQHKLKGMESIRFLQTALLEGDKEGLCGENGVCRRNFGEGCTTSKNFLSVCATFCVDNNEFRGSHCIANGAKRYKMNVQTFIYEPRPEKQKRAESVVDHIIIQLREGRKALRSDKRLFFNTLCTPPSVNMIPGTDNRRRVAEACAYFLYNGFPPPGVLNMILIGGPANPQGYTPPAPPMIGQPLMPPPQPPAAPPVADASPDDINAPIGGLPEDPNAGEDKGAVYDGPGTPIIEDKESAPTNKKGKKGKKGKKSKKSKTAAPKATIPAAPPAPTDDTSPADDQTDATPDAESQAVPADDTNAASTDDDSTPPDDGSVAPDENTAPADDADADQQAAPDAAPAPAPPQQAAPAQKKNALLGGIQGMMQKFGKKKGGQQANDENADPNADGNDQNAAPAGAKMPSVVGKFMKF
jgi:hypothetical protein